LLFSSPLCGTLLSLTIVGIFWGIGRTHKNEGRDKEERLTGERGAIGNYNVLREELDWTSHEAEVANLRSEILMRRMLHLEEDIMKIKESIKMSLDVFMEIDRKLSKVEANNVIGGKRKQIRTRKVREGDIADVSNEVERITDLDRQVLNLLSANGPMSSHDLQVKIGKSREHISRLLGKLVDKELIKRNRLGRQFTYDVINLSENNDKGPVAS